MELYCLGDSLTFGYGVRAAQRWTTLAAQKSGWQLINLGIPGDTTGGMMARLQTQLMPDLAHRRGCRVLLMGGANDIFYGGSMESARANMGGMIHQLLTTGAVPMVGAPLPICIEDISRSWESVVDFPPGGTASEAVPGVVPRLLQSLWHQLHGSPAVFRRSAQRPAAGAAV